jgi:hypothetical protein
MTGHNFEILMNDSVDELVGATEEVRRGFPCPISSHVNGPSSQSPTII